MMKRKISNRFDILKDSWIKRKHKLESNKTERKKIALNIEAKKLEIERRNGCGDR